MECHVGGDQLRDRVVADRLLARGDHALAARDVVGGRVHGGKRGGERLDAEAQLVDRAHEVAIERRHHQAAAARLAHELLLLQQQQRLADRLTRYRQFLRNRFLRQALAGREPAVANGLENRPVDLVDDRRRRLHRVHRADRRSRGVHHPIIQCHARYNRRPPHRSRPPLAAGAADREDPSS